MILVTVLEPGVGLIDVGETMIQHHLERNSEGSERVAIQFAVA